MKQAVRGPILFVCAVLPAVLAAFLIFKFGVDVPHMDEWQTPGFHLIQQIEGRLSFADFFAQHNESRKVFPALLFVGLAQIEGWHVKPIMFLTLGLALLVAYGFYRLSLKTLKVQQPIFWLCTMAMTWLVFNPMQWSNWLWGIQMITFVPISCIVLNVNILSAHKHPVFTWMVCLLAALVSTFSFANGMLIWVITLPVLLLYIAHQWRRRWWMLPGWLIAMAITLAIYFHDYTKPSAHLGWSYVGYSLSLGIQYFLTFLGAPFANGQPFLATMLGLLLFGFYGFVLYYFLYDLLGKNARFSMTQSSMEFSPVTLALVPWLSIGAYSLLSAFLTMYGRVGFGLSQALASRYVTFSMFLPICLIYCAAILYADVKNNHLQRLTRSQKTQLNQGLYFMAGLFAMAFLSSYLSAIGSMQEAASSRMYDKACLVLYNLPQRESCVPQSMLLIDESTLRQRAGVIEAAGMLRPRPLSGQTLGELQASSSHPQDRYGYFDQLECDLNHQCTVSGWATLPHAHRSADAVILSHVTPAGDQQILQIIPTDQARPDVAQVFNSQDYLFVGWSSSFSLADLVDETLTQEDLKIRAWAFDANRKQIFPLQGPDRKAALS